MRAAAPSSSRCIPQRVAMEMQPSLENEAHDVETDEGCHSEFSAKSLLLSDADLETTLEKRSCHLTRRSFLCFSLFVLVVLGVLALVAMRKAHQLYDSFSDHYVKSARIKDAVSLAALPPDAGSRGCLPGTICLCNNLGLDSCASWSFEVGDVLIFKSGLSATLYDGMSSAVMQAMYQGAVHAAIVTEVRGPALSDIIVTESLKGTDNDVMVSTLLEVLGFRTYHGIWIRRVDRARFPNFVNRLNDITTWARARIGEPFDMPSIFEKMVPFPWRWADPRWIEALPGCEGREKALNLYHSGGPGRWFCSQFVAWTLAFPGGLNTDYGDNGECVTPPWNGHVEFLEMAPGDLIDQPFFDANGIYAACPDLCKIGVGF